MFQSIFISLLVAGAWLFNIICWVQGFYSAAVVISNSGNSKEETSSITDRIRKAFGHIVFTMADIGGVGLVRYLIGTYAAAIVPSSIIAIGISLWIRILRKRFEQGKPLMNSSYNAHNTVEDDDED